MVEPVLLPSGNVEVRWSLPSAFPSKEGSSEDAESPERRPVLRGGPNQGVQRRERA